jgi:hypothetical protein
MPEAEFNGHHHPQFESFSNPMVALSIIVQTPYPL